MINCISGAVHDIERQVDSTPEKQFLDDTANMMYSILSSLGEFIDNSIEATRYNDESLARKISVSLDLNCGNEYVEIVDNGEGFERSKLRAGSTLGVKGRDKAVTEMEDFEKERIDRVFDSRLHRFGVGLKYANYFLGSKFKITTKRFEHSTEFQITHSKTDAEWKTNEREMLCKKKGSGTNVRIEGLEMKIFEQLKRKHGDRWSTLLCQNLRTIYYPYLLTDDVPGFSKMLANVKKMSARTLEWLKKGPKSRNKDRRWLITEYEAAQDLLHLALGEDTKHFIRESVYSPVANKPNIYVTVWLQTTAVQCAPNHSIPTVGLSSKLMWGEIPMIFRK